MNHRYKFGIRMYLPKINKQQPKINKQQFLKSLCGWIQNKKCIPIIGAGASATWLPLADDVVKEWVIKFDYPENLPLSLSAISQFIATSQGDNNYPKKLLSERLRSLRNEVSSQADFGASIYGVLAKLELPIYITTNYDHLMEFALLRESKQPVSDFCRWNEELWKYAKYYDINSELYDSNFKPTAERPVVYHLHGDMDYPKSMVLTEDDLISFMYTMTSEVDPRTFFGKNIYRQLLHTHLYLGYSLRDINFRLILKFIPRGDERPSFAVMLLEKYTEPSLSEDKLVPYLENYFKNIIEAYVFWGDLKEFASLLLTNYTEFDKNRKKSHDTIGYLQK